MKMTPAEAWMAVTANAAAAVGEGERVGRIQPGYRADLVLFDGGDYRHIPYHYGHNHARLVVAGGALVFEAGQSSRCT
jgi:imidazolonepropionase